MLLEGSPVTGALVVDFCEELESLNSTELERYFRRNGIIYYSNQSTKHYAEQSALFDIRLGFKKKGVKYFYLVAPLGNGEIKISTIRKTYVVFMAGGYDSGLLGGYEPSP